MINKIYYLVIFTFLTISVFLNGIEYDVQDIGTLQTHSSEAIAINNNSQILGWFNIDGTKDDKHYFVRDKDGNFNEIQEDESIIPSQFQNVRINWKYITDDGKAYGTINLPMGRLILFMWDKYNGIVNLGTIPGEIVKINNAGQVLIKSIEDYENGKLIKRPAIWDHGTITKLYGLTGDVGIEAEESYGFDMNNKGEVVGQSTVFLSYKNALYKQTHAVKWTDGQAIDLHRAVPKAESTNATAINDLGDVIIGSYLVRADGQIREYHFYTNTKATSTKYFLALNYSSIFLDREAQLTNVGGNKIFKDFDCIWMYPTKCIDMNDKGEIIAKGRTIYGEEHIMLLVPIETKN